MFRTFEPSEALIEALKKKSGGPNDGKEKRSDAILASAPKSLEVYEFATYTSNQGGLNFRTLAGNKQTDGPKQQESHSNLLNQFLTQERKLYGTTVSSAATASTKASSKKDENRKTRFYRTGQTVVSPIKYDQRKEEMPPPPVPPVPERSPLASPDPPFQKKQRPVAAPTETVQRSQSQSFTGTLPDANVNTLPTCASSPCLRNTNKSPAIGSRRPSGSRKNSMLITSVDASHTLQNAKKEILASLSASVDLTAGRKQSISSLSGTKNPQKLPDPPMWGNPSDLNLADSMAKMNEKMSTARTQMSATSVTSSLFGRRSSASLTSRSKRRLSSVGVKGFGTLKTASTCTTASSLGDGINTPDNVIQALLLKNPQKFKANPVPDYLQVPPDYVRKIRIKDTPTDLKGVPLTAEEVEVIKEENPVEKRKVKKIIHKSAKDDINNTFASRLQELKSKQHFIMSLKQSSVVDMLKKPLPDYGRSDTASNASAPHVRKKSREGKKPKRQPKKEDPRASEPIPVGLGGPAGSFLTHPMMSRQSSPKKHRSFNEIMESGMMDSVEEDHEDIGLSREQSVKATEVTKQNAPPKEPPVAAETRIYKCSNCEMACLAKEDIVEHFKKQHPHRRSETGKSWVQIYRHVDLQFGTSRTMVFNEEDVQIALFDDQTFVKLLINEKSSEIQEYVQDLCNRGMHGLLIELEQRLVEDSRNYLKNKTESNKIIQQQAFRFFELTEESTAKEAQEAYRRSARELHPDKNGGSADAKDKFQQMKNLYEAVKKQFKGEILESPDKEEEDAKNIDEDEMHDFLALIEYDASERPSMERAFHRMLSDMKYVHEKLGKLHEDVQRVCSLVREQQMRKQYLATQERALENVPKVNTALQQLLP